MDDLEAFARLLTAIRPWLGQLVVVGGWACRLHRFHGRAKTPGYLPVQTRDADLAFSPDAALAGDVRTALLDAGFTEELLGDISPPATHYGLGEKDGAFYAEFLTSLSGSGIRRSGKHDDTLTKAGITAQKMRYLELLLIEPWSVRVGPGTGVPMAADLDLFVPNPTSFIVQKLLIHADRPTDKKAQDVLYIHDTVEMFGGSLDELRRLWIEEIRPKVARPWARRAKATARLLFAEVSDTIRDAARIPQDRRLAPDDIQRVCRYGLVELLGLSEAKAE